MIQYKALKNMLLQFIPTQDVEKFHDEGYTIIKSDDFTDLERVTENEEIPEGFIE